MEFLNRINRRNLHYALPTIVTVARLCAVPVVLWMMIEAYFVYAFWVFTIACLSDALDGLLARLLDARTQLGAYLDPIADKVLIVTTIVSLGLLGKIPLWLVLLVVFRDLLIIGGVILFSTVHGPVAMLPTVISKLNSLLQFILVSLALAMLSFNWKIDWLLYFLIYLVAVTTVASGADYLIRALKDDTNRESLNRKSGE